MHLAVVVRNSDAPEVLHVDLAPSTNPRIGTFLSDIAVIQVDGLGGAANDAVPFTELFWVYFVLCVSKREGKVRNGTYR